VSNPWNASCHVLRSQPPSLRQVAAQRLCNGGNLGGAGGSTAGAASTAATAVALLPWRKAKDKKVPVARRDSKYHQL